MTAFPIVDTVTASQGTGGGITNAWTTQVTDGNNILGTSGHPFVTTIASGTVSFQAGSSIIVMQDGPGSITGSWFVQVTDDNNVLGTSAHPLVVTVISGSTNVAGTVTVQGLTGGEAVSVSGTLNVGNFPATQNVQGVVGGQAVSVSGTITSNQGTAGTVAGSWPVEVTDGNNVLGTSAHPLVVTVVSGSTNIAGTVTIQGLTGGEAVSVSGTVTSSQGTPNTTANAWPVKLASGSLVVGINSGSQLYVTQDDPASVLLSLVYDQSANIAGAFASANTWFKGVYYTVPTGYKFMVGAISSWSADAKSALRTSRVLSLATFNVGTSVFSAGSSFTTPQFASFLEAEVTTATNAGTNSVINITYTNQDGTSGRVASVTVQKSAAVGTKFVATLSGSDYGARSIQSVVTSSGGPLTGIVNINGGILLDTNIVSTIDLVTNVTPANGTMMLRTNEILALDYGAPGGAGNVERSLRVTGILEAS